MNGDEIVKQLQDAQIAQTAIPLLLSAVQQSKDSVIITTAKLDPPHPKIIFVNPAFSQMTGYTSEEVLGKSPRMLQGAHTDREILNALRQHLIDGMPFHAEAINYRKDGTEFYIEWHITPIRNSQETITHFLAIQRDVSARKRMEEERDRLLQQEQESRAAAEAANRIKDEFLAMLSHELRTPLTPIIGWARMLQTNQLPEAKLKEGLSIIEQHAKRQAQTIDDLLDLSRIVRGKMSLSLAPVALLTPIAAALETVRLAAEAKSIHIKTMLDITAGHVMGDAGRLQQVFWNLLANSLKFTHKGGYITVSLERVGRSARISICDTGQGIRSDFLPYVFDRFRQEDSSITRQFGGLGLGLAISRQIVEAHGGTITAESSGVRQGATLTVCLPLITTTQPAKLDSEPSYSSLDLSGIKVLVAEDNAGTQDFLTFVLEQYGAEVTAVDDATDAIAAIEQTQLDILIIDIAMPKVDGYALIRQIRMKPLEQGGTIPAIALTAYVGQQDRQQALKAGFQVHFPKPIEPTEFVAVVARLVGK